MFTVRIWNQWGGLHSISRYTTRDAAERRANLVNTMCQFHTATLDES